MMWTDQDRSRQRFLTASFEPSYPTAHSAKSGRKKGIAGFGIVSFLTSVYKGSRQAAAQMASDERWSLREVGELPELHSYSLAGIGAGRAENKHSDFRKWCSQP